MVVPLLPQYRSAAAAGIVPPVPRMLTMRACRSDDTSNPSRAKPSSITSVSSANSTFDSRPGPSARAASTSARLVRLFDPGGDIVMANGRSNGRIVRSLIPPKLRPNRRRGKGRNREGGQETEDRRQEASDRDLQGIAEAWSVN